MAQKRTLDYYDDDFDFDTESLSSFESDEDFVHSISSSEDDTSDEENFSSVRQWCKIDSSSPAPSRFSFTGDVVELDANEEMEENQLSILTQKGIQLKMEGNTPTQIKDELDSVYGDSAVSFTAVKFWAAEFKFGQRTGETMNIRDIQILQLPMKTLPKFTKWC
ncbi:piggyBac transposable element-derived protein 4 [Trichonephila clavipes]|nr:piggyBac transposable element-derived protein 4 [Trichonephila clavipes]